MQAQSDTDKRKNIDDIRVAYNNVFRRFFHVPRVVGRDTVSVTNAQNERRIPTFCIMREKGSDSILRRLDISENELVKAIVKIRYSPTRRSWRTRVI